MEQKPLHYDGSVQVDHEAFKEVALNESIEITDEMRKNITTNPYWPVTNS